MVKSEQRVLDVLKIVLDGFDLSIDDFEINEKDETKPCIYKEDNKWYVQKETYKKQFPILEAATFHFFEVIAENKDVARAMKDIFEIMS